MEELLVKHRKEQRDLQSKITQKKKSATKKTRKGVNDECADLERELKERQERELANLKDLTEDTNGTQEDRPEEPPDTSAAEGAPAPPQADANVATDSLSTLSLTPPVPPTAPSNPVSPPQPPHHPPKKPNRQKARLQRREAEAAAAAAQAADEASSLPDLRARERGAMQAAFEARGLREHEVRADGHCLYSAFADQMGALGVPLGAPGAGPRIAVEGEGGKADAGGEAPGYRAVRRAAAAYIEAHADAFEPFLEEPLREYVRKVRETGEWGGQLELLALARTYGVRVNVLQGDGRVEEIEGGEGSEGEKSVWLAYYRHGFGLGEHYNSLRKAP